MEPFHDPIGNGMVGCGVNAADSEETSHLLP